MRDRVRTSEYERKGGTETERARARECVRERGRARARKATLRGCSAPSLSVK